MTKPKKRGVKLDFKAIHRCLAQYKRDDDKRQQRLFQECSRRKP